MTFTHELKIKDIIDLTVSKEYTDEEKQLIILEILKTEMVTDVIELSLYQIPGEKVNDEIVFEVFFKKVSVLVLPNRFSFEFLNKRPVSFYKADYDENNENLKKIKQLLALKVHVFYLTKFR